ncbi:MAG: alpha/beta hydrolase [Cyanobacteriota bacterium]|nr:alpha/beta hydrolase [Cyanobacteriota bacterium]
MFPNLIKRHSLAVVSVGLGLGLMNIGKPALAAKDVALVSGAFRRSIPVQEFEHLAETGEAIGMLGNLLEFSGQQPEQVAKLLNQSISLPLVLTSRLIETRIGEAIIRKVSKIIYPIYTPQPEVSVPAIRAGVINGLQSSKGLTAVSFLKAYPNDVMAVNLPALFGVMEKAESIAGLVQFFSDSPLDGLKEAKP